MSITCCVQECPKHEVKKKNLVLSTKQKILRQTSLPTHTLFLAPGSPFNISFLLFLSQTTFSKTTFCYTHINIHLCALVFRDGVGEVFSCDVMYRLVDK